MSPKDMDNYDNANPKFRKSRPSRKSRWGLAAFLVGCSFLLTVIMGGLLSLRDHPKFCVNLHCGVE